MEYLYLKKVFNRLGIKCYASKARLFMKYRKQERELGLTLDYFPEWARKNNGSSKIRNVGSGQKIYYSEFLEYLMIKEMLSKHLPKQEEYKELITIKRNKNYNFTK